MKNSNSREQGSDHENRGLSSMTSILARAGFLSLLFLALPLQAAELSITATQLPVDLGQYLDYLEDPGGEFGIEDVRAIDTGWERLTEPQISLGVSDSAHWFKITLSGNQLAGEELAIVADSPSIDQVDAFFFQNGELVKTARVGDTVPFSQLEFPSRTPIIPFRMAEDGTPTELYICVNSGGGIQLPISVSNMSLIALDQQSTLAFFGGIFTFFFICLSACVFLYATLRERLYLGITLLLAGVVVMYLTLSGIGRLWLWGETSEFNTRVGYIGASVLVYGLCVMGRSLKFDFKYAESIAVVLRFVGFLMLPVALYFLLIPFDQIARSNVIPFMILALITMVSVFVMVAIRALQGSQVAIYLLFSSVLVLTTFLWQAAYMFSVMERSPGATYISGGITAAAIVFMLLALSEFARNKNQELSLARMETKAKGDFLKNVSREFLTPVHLILANSKRLLAAQSNKLDEPTRQHMKTVIQQSDHLHNLINDLLEMAELESDSFEPEFELVEISHFLNEVKELMSPPALEKGLEIETEFAAANLLVQTDRARLQHSLLNILTNAIKYTDSGSILIGHKAIYFRRKLGMEIFIRDTGRGMSQEFQQRLFQEFTREDEVSEKNPEGTGLGLVIVKRIIERLGGEISFESQKDVGSTFYIRLPLRVHQV